MTVLLCVATPSGTCGLDIGSRVTAGWGSLRMFLSTRPKSGLHYVRAHSAGQSQSHSTSLSTRDAVLPQAREEPVWRADAIVAVTPPFHLPNQQVFLLTHGTHRPQGTPSKVLSSPASGSKPGVSGDPGAAVSSHSTRLFLN